MKLIKAIFLFLCILTGYAGYSLANYAPRPHVDQGLFDQRLPRQLVMVGDANKVVFYSQADDGDWMWWSMRAADEIVTDANYIWPDEPNDVNSVLIIRSISNSTEYQLDWGPFDANAITWDGNEFTFPDLTPWNVTFVDSNGFPIYEDPNYYDFTYYEPSGALGIGLSNLGTPGFADNRIRVYGLIHFDPNLFNTTIGRGSEDTATGPNNVTIGRGAGISLTEGKQNSLGGKDSGYSISGNEDNAFWGYQAGKNVKTSPVRDEALFVASRYKWTWLDHDYVESSIESIEAGGGGGSCDIDPNGNIIASNGPNDDGCYLTYFDVNKNRSDDLFTPSDNWGTGSTLWQASTACRFDSDGSHVYVTGFNVSGYVRFYKFPVTGGAEDWIYEALALGPYSMYVDASDNVYMWRTTGLWAAFLDIIDTDGNLSSSIEFAKYSKFNQDTWVDEANSRVYVCGNGYDNGGVALGYCIGAADLDGSNINYFARSKGASQWGWQNVCVYKYGNFIYSCGERSAHGVGGANANIFKLDTSLNLVASYDAGATVSPQWIRLTNDGNLIVMCSNASAENYGGVILDTDLNLVDTWTIATPQTMGTWMREFIVLDYAVGDVNEGSRNSALGSQALAGASAGAEPNEATAGGFKSLFSTSSGNLATAYGAYSGYGVTTANNGLYLGPYAGYNQTTDPNRFVLDNQLRESEADEAASSLFYGYIAADANDSWLNINADVNMPKTLDVNEIEITELTLESAWTAGSVLFADANGALSDDSENNANFSWDNANNTLDVNQVDVNNVVVIKPNSAVFQPAADSTTFFQVLDADGGTPVLNVDSTNEKVGIGTASPSSKLHVAGGLLHVTGSGTPTSGIGLEIEYDGTQSDILSFDRDTTQYKPLRLRGSYILLDTATLPSGGGPVIVDSRLQVTGNYAPSSGAGFELGYDPTDDGGLGGGNFVCYNRDAARYIVQILDAKSYEFQVSNTGKMYIATTGYLGLGEASPETLIEATSTAPYLTLHNSTHEDADGGQESKIIFKGEDSVGSEEIIAQIQASKDGATATENAGELIFYTRQSAAGGDALTERLRIDSAGVITNAGSSVISGSATYGIDLSSGTWSSGVMNWDANPDVYAGGTRVMGFEATNMFVGEGAFNGASGLYNVGFGYQVGYNNSTAGAGVEGEYNVYMGYQAGYGNTPATNNTGYRNVGIGYKSLNANTSGQHNVGLGAYTLVANTTGSDNFAIGYFSQRYGTTAGRNVSIGTSALRNNVGGNDNVVIGYSAGEGVFGNSLSHITAIGGSSGYKLTTGIDNTFIGYVSGYNTTSGARNIYIGYYAGYRQTTNSDLLIIDNQDRGSAAAELTNSLIYGVFNAAVASQSLRVNAATFTLNGGTDTDITINLTGTTNSGVVKWMEDEDYVEFDDDIVFAGDAVGLPYGDMYTNSTIAVVISDNNPTEIKDATNDGFTSGEVHRVTFPTGGDEHYISVDVAGRYLISYSVTCSQNSPSSAINIESGVMVGGVAQNPGRSMRTVSNSTDIGNMGGTCILDLAASAQVSLYITNETNTTNIDVEHANLTVMMVGGT